MPDEIKRLGPNAIAVYWQALGQGKFTNNIVRCMFIGHFGVGKTTLVRQLQGLSAANVQSTDGIDVYRGKCYYNKDTKEWFTPGNFISYNNTYQSRIHIGYLALLRPLLAAHERLRSKTKV